jgi:hypothetical protein
MTSSIINNQVYNLLVGELNRTRRTRDRALDILLRLQTKINYSDFGTTIVDDMLDLLRSEGLLK